MENKEGSRFIGRLKEDINLQWLAIGLVSGALLSGIIGGVAFGLLLGVVFSNNFAKKRK